MKDNAFLKDVGQRSPTIFGDDLRTIGMGPMNQGKFVCLFSYCHANLHYTSNFKKDFLHLHKKIKIALPFRLIASVVGCIGDLRAMGHWCSTQLAQRSPHEQNLYNLTKNFHILFITVQVRHHLLYHLRRY